MAVDPQSRNNILEGIKKLIKQGATIVYTSHYMEEVEQICTKLPLWIRESNCQWDKGRTKGHDKLR